MVSTPSLNPVSRDKKSAGVQQADGPTNFKGLVKNLRGGGLVQTLGGPWFFIQAQKGGSNNLVHVIKGGHYFLCKDAGVKESIYNSSVVTVILL